MPTVNLDDYRTEGVGLFSGYPRGQDVRQRAALDELDRGDAVVTIHVPEDVFAVTSSFLQGMFTDSIRALGEEEFRRRYRFTGRSIQPTVDLVINFVLKKKLPL